MKLKDIKCTFCGTRSKGIFCNLSQNTINKIDSEKSVQKYEPGQIIFYDGYPAFALFCIFSGLVKLYKTGKNGDQYIIRLLKKGDILGYRAILEEGSYAATAEALEPTILCVIPKENFLKVLKEEPTSLLCLLKKMAEELRISEENMISYKQETVRQRTARMLLYLIEHLGLQDKMSISLRKPLRGIDMARIVGTTPETFSRTLHKLEKMGVIRLTRNEIIIEQIEYLKKIIGGRDDLIKIN